jgi:hypothetical protein
MDGNATITIPALSPDLFWFIVGILAGTLITAVSLYAVELAVRYHYRPIIEFDRKVSPIPISVNWSSGKYGKVGDVDLNKIPYIVNRIKVDNKGKTAAENCKIAFIVKRPNITRERACWSVPSERYTMTINAHDSEYCDICAFSEKDPSQLVKNQKAGTEVYADEKRGRGTTLTADDVPYRVAPTEEGWGKTIGSNRNLGHAELECTIMVSGKNCGREELIVRIREHDDGEGRIVELVK